MMTPRENLLAMIHGENPEYVPFTGECTYLCGMPLAPLVEQPLETGTDPFGVHWLVTPIGAMHDTTVPPMFEDIEDWRKYVKIPDLSKVDFEGFAAREMAGVDRNEKAVIYYASCGCFERLASFMGFENALCALAEDPEECRAFFETITDYKISLANHIIDAYDIDIFYNFDDIATARSLFISPATYREVLKPCHARLAKAVRDRGVIFAEHTCGKCEAVLDDYVEIGVQIWHSAQCMNDLPAILKKYKGRLVVEGGWDSQGIPGTIAATADDVRRETVRCMEEYGKLGGFVLLPTMFNERGNSVIVGDDRFPAVIEEWNKRRFFH